MTPRQPLSAAARHQAVIEWNDPLEYPAAGLLPELVARRAAERPQAVALTAGAAGAAGITYGELDAWAARLAAALRRRGAGSEGVVGLLLPRSPALVAALLAVWKCGGACLPLDPGHPAERLRHLLGDALRGPRPRLVLAAAELAGRVPDAGVETLLVETAGEDATAEAAARPADLLPGQLAYVLYTSGSTGSPKGIAVPHAALANRILWACAAEVDAASVFLHKTTPTFDVALAEIFAPLAAGGRCAVARPGGERDLAHLAALIAREGVTHASFPPAALRLLLDLPGAAESLASLRVLVTGGETVPPDLPARARAVAPGATLYNRYGPTEATISVLTGACDPRSRGATVPLGRPIARARVYVLDPQMRPLPPGEPGEIHVGGPCLARGYVGRPGLTAAAFVPDPVGGAPGERLYRTGDRGRWRPDGAVEFLGRVDSQVKIRGFRVEVEEVEAALNGCPGVREAAVVAHREPATGSHRLHAWVLPEPGVAFDAVRLRRALAGRLADYMIPALLSPCAALPRTLSGKVDRAALARLAASAAQPASLAAVGAETAAGAPRGEPERRLLQLVEEVAGRSGVGVDDDLLELGFHSLLLAVLQARLREISGREVPIPDLVRCGTVRRLAALLAGGGAAGVGPGDLAAEAALGPEIQPLPGAGRAAVEAPATVLLTGASGFLGSHLLAALLARTAARVLCLVRDPAGLRRGRERYGWGGESATWSEEGRIVPLVGDLSRPRLGLSGAAFEELAQSVEAIYHCGARVHSFYPYEALRAANVEGTREILRLACAGRVKPLHHVSTLAVVPPEAPGEEPRAEAPLDDGARGVSGGYAQSKWVAERMVQAAVERGIPAVIYRPGWITAASRTGAGNPDDLLTRLAAGSLRAGLAPALGAIELHPTPVDWVAAAIVGLSLRPQSLNGIFHLVNPHPLALAEVLERLREIGHPLRTVPLGRWAAALAELAAGEERELLGPLAALLRRLEGAGEGEGERLRPRRFASDRTRSALAAECPRIDRRLLDLYLGALLPGPGQGDLLLEAGGRGGRRGVER